MLIAATLLPFRAQTASSPQIQGIQILSTSPQVVVDLVIKGPSAPSEALPFYQLFQLQKAELATGPEWLHVGLRSQPASTTPLLNWSQPATGPKGFFRAGPVSWHTPFSDLTGGRFRVGYMSKHLTSPTRQGFGLGTNRSFMVSIWYPAAPDSSPALSPHTLYPPQFGIYLFTKDFITVSRPATLITNLVGHALRDLPPDAAEAPFPVILYGHGGQWFRHDNAHKAAEMASRGYVVVALDFYDAFMSVLPNGQLAVDDSATDFPHTRLSIALHDASVVDTLFLLDALEEWNRTDPQWAGLLDLQRIGVWGWSFGAAVMADAARRDARIKAAMLFDAAFWSAPELNALGLDRPVFFLQSQFSPTSDWEVPALALFQKNKTSAYFLRIAGSRHVDFTDLELINQPTTQARRFQSHQIRYSAAFFDKHLRQQESPILDGPAPGDPELVAWQKK